MRNVFMDVSLILALLKQNISDGMWEKFILTQETVVCLSLCLSFHGLNPLMEAVLYQPNLTANIVGALVPKQQQENVEFWEMRCTQEFVLFLFICLFTVLHLLFGHSLPNILSRIQVLCQYVPPETMERLLQITDTVTYTKINFYLCFIYVHIILIFHFLTLYPNKRQCGFTPLMYALWKSPEIENSILSSLIPKMADAEFWKLTLNEMSDFEGCNVVHLSLMNPHDRDLYRLKCLQQQMAPNVWNELLEMKTVGLVCLFFFCLYSIVYFIFRPKTNRPKKHHSKWPVV
ncbi:hypothetical protein RFI_05558 [Reticulomyxa filosa]|uniref:Uncharacterized protein n=1 Tax=Reticulomyxa filosa TaxID=46433 RepID=X6P097_RETFI|nr:hypothetical protein RFI_05558 [Reticulomyxa filosa]|eukprot:ETO31563.1 hypothetical protein RFI_05558 [Reticulomyxa filosa]